MELKRDTEFADVSQIKTFNRTRMELKLNIFPACTLTPLPFNRTRMELKPFFHRQGR